MQFCISQGNRGRQFPSAHGGSCTCLTWTLTVKWTRSILTEPVKDLEMASILEIATPGQESILLLNLRKLVFRKYEQWSEIKK